MSWVCPRGIIWLDILKIHHLGGGGGPPWSDAWTTSTRFIRCGRREAKQIQKTHMTTKRPDKGPVHPGRGLPGSQSGIGSRLGVLAWRATWGLPSYGATTCRKCCKGLVHCQLSGSSDDPIPGKNLHYSNFWHSGFVLFAAGVCDLNVPRYEEFSKAVNTRSSVISALHHSSLVKYGKTLILFGLLTHIE